MGRACTTIALLALAGCATDLSIKGRDGRTDPAVDTLDVDADVPTDGTDAADTADDDPLPPRCGNGTLEAGEECDGDGPRSCTTACGSTGEQACVGCAWASCEPPGESCNGLDDDCNDLVDDVGSLGLAGGPVRVTSAAGASQAPSIDWTGSGFGLAWEDERGGSWSVRSAVLAADASVVWADGLVIAGLTDARAPSLAWAGGTHGLAFTDAPSGGTPDVIFAAMNVQGDLVPPVRMVADVASAALRRPVIVARPGGFAVAWEAPARAGFALLDADGARIGSAIALEDDVAASTQLDMAWSGSVFGVAWRDERDGNEEIYAAILDATPAVVAADARLSSDPAASDEPSIAWDGSSFVVAWSDQADGDRDVYVGRMDASGAVIGSAVNVTGTAYECRGPSLAWTGSCLALAWSGSGTGEMEIEAVLLDAAALLPLFPPVAVSLPGGRSVLPDLAWTGSSLGLAWQDDRDGNAEIYAAVLVRTGCP